MKFYVWITLCLFLNAQQLSRGLRIARFLPQMLKQGPQLLGLKTLMGGNFKAILYNFLGSQAWYCHSCLINSIHVTSYVWVCRDAVNRIINLTESTIASGDDEGCVKVIFLQLAYWPLLHVTLIIITCSHVTLIIITCSSWKFPKGEGARLSWKLNWTFYFAAIIV